MLFVLRCGMALANCFPAMRNITTFAISAIALAGVASAEIESSVSAGYHSRYLFRGIDFTGAENDMVDFGLEVGGACDCGADWYAGLWHGRTLNGNGTTGSLYNETDIYAGVSKDLGIGTVDVGFIVYTYDDRTENDSEAYLGLSTGYAGFEIGATTYVGTGGSWKNGVFQEFTAGFGQEVGGVALGIELSAGFAFGQAGYGADVDGLATYSATVSTDYSVSDDITLSPYISYVQNNEAWNRGTVDGFVGGVSVGFNF